MIEMLILIGLSIGISTAVSILLCFMFEWKTSIWIIRRWLGLEPPYFDKFKGYQNAKKILDSLVDKFNKEEESKC